MEPKLLAKIKVRATRWVARIGMIALATLAMVTFVDVVGRYVFNHPLPGGIEISSSLMAILIFSSFVVATDHDEHVRVDLLVDSISSRVRTVLLRLASALTAVVALLFAYAIVTSGLHQFETGEVTPVLRLPIYPVTLAAGVIAIVFFLIAVWMLFARRKPHATEHVTPAE